MEITKRSKFVEILRWAVFLPGAFLAGWIAWTLVHILGEFSFRVVGIDPDSFLSKWYFYTSGNVSMGIAFVYVGAKIAPCYRKIVAYVMGVLGFGVFVLYPGIMVKNSWALWGYFCVIIGLGGAVYLIYKGETDIT